MRSEWDDAPNRIKMRNKAGELFKWLAAGIMGGGITLTILYFLGANLNFPFYEKVKPESLTKQYPDFKPLDPIEPPTRTSEEIFWANVEADKRKKKEEEERQARQISFNDHNYQPKNPISTYSPPQYQSVAPATKSNQTRQIMQERTAKWIKSWNGGTNYLAEWLAVDNYIDSTSVCANHKRGSIDYRECRKAAKQHFHEECRTWRARYDSDRKPHSDRMKTRFCSASSSFNPMG